MHVFRNNVTDWVVAESAEHAAILHRRYLLDECDWDEGDLEHGDVLVFTQEPDDKPLSVLADSANSAIEQRVTKTCGEWAATEPAGMLCSTEW